VSSSNVLSDLEFAEYEISQALDMLNSYNSPGPEGLNPKAGTTIIKYEYHTALFLCCAGFSYRCPAGYTHA